MVSNTLAVLRTGLLSVVVWFTALAPASAAELTVESPGKDKPLRLGGTLVIKATGNQAKAITNEVAKGVANRKLALFLGGIEIPGLLSSYRVPDAAAKTQDEVYLSLVVDRNSEDDASRKAWDALLRPQTRNDPELAVALAVGSQSPVLVEGPGATKGVRFQVSNWIVGGYAAGLVCLGICLVFLYQKSHMLRDGGDPANAFSLARTQMAFWGIVVLSCFLGVAVACGSLEHIPAQTLILLGISATTGLSAAIMDSGTPPTLKSSRTGLLGFFDDICIGDQGASFHRVQIVLWTVVLGGFFIWNVCQVISMPVFSNTLLVLMGITNGTYLGFKTQEK